MNFRKAPATLMMMATIVMLPILSTTRAQAEESLFHGTPPGTVLQPTEELTVIKADPTTQTGELKFVLPAGSSQYMLISHNQAFQLAEQEGQMTPSAQATPKTIGFTIDPNLPPGDYEQDVDIVADRKLVQRFVLKVSIRPKA